MLYYQLTDDVHVAGRWHLDELMADGEDVSDSFTDGCEVTVKGRLSASVGRAGRPLEFSLTSFAVPVVSTVLAEAIARVAGRSVQRIPLVVPGFDGFEVLNATRIVKCLDERRSEFSKWKSTDHRADLAGQYREVGRLVIDPKRVPKGAHFFRLDGWSIALIVSERVKSAMESAGCLGACFEKVSPQ